MEFKVVNIKPNQAISITDNCTPMELPDKYGELYGELRPIIKAQSLKKSGTAFGIYHSFTKDNVRVEAGFMVEGNAKQQGRAKVTRTYGGKAASARYVGPYSGLGEAWSEFNKWIKENNHKVTGACFEFYVNDPEVEADEAKLITDLYFPIA